MFLWIFTTFQSDNGALLFGRLFGTFHPFPHISPAKSIQGVVGAFVLPYLSLIPLVFIGETRFTPCLGHGDAVVISVLTGFLAFGGDLTESFLKRVAGVKDSGNLFPGHGGILDRLDSLVWVTPFIYYYSSWLNHLS
jgi:phosphatidate cytidylyltransferase